jgi:hypothetical protein
MFDQTDTIQTNWPDVIEQRFDRQCSSVSLAAGFCKGSRSSGDLLVAYTGLA